jgi:hypothetical protein
VWEENTLLQDNVYGSALKTHELYNLGPIRLSRRLRLFNGADWIFEIKHDTLCASRASFTVTAR